MKKIISVLVLASLTLASFSSLAKVYESSPRSKVRSFGDYAQIINPLIAGGIASQEKGFGHFAIIYAQSMSATQLVKHVSKQTKWRPSKRPSIKGKTDRYEGMPSGHTNSAWIGASYVRVFSEDYKYMCIPLYISAAITGYSRVQARRHTTSQVVWGAIFAEATAELNKKLNWSTNYRSVNIIGGESGGSLLFEFKL
ncbi:MAG: hypothetical protein DGJ47_001026 [Rickettsiaceae bacterium]